MNGFDILPCHNQYKVSSKETFPLTKDVIIDDENHFKHRFPKAGYLHWLVTFTMKIHWFVQWLLFTIVPLKHLHNEAWKEVRSSSIVLCSLVNLNQNSRQLSRTKITAEKRTRSPAPNANTENISYLFSTYWNQGCSMYYCYFHNLKSYNLFLLLKVTRQEN